MTVLKIIFVRNVKRTNENDVIALIIFELHDVVVLHNSSFINLIKNEL